MKFTSFLTLKDLLSFGKFSALGVSSIYLRPYLVLNLYNVSEMPEINQ